MEEVIGLVAERDGVLVGYGDRWCGADRDRALVDVRVRTGEMAAARALLSELEGLARPDVEPGSPASTVVAGSDETLAEVLTEAGYEPTRQSYRMAIALDAATPPSWPPGIVVSGYAPEDESEVHATHQETFADLSEHIQLGLDEWRRNQIETPSFDPTLWFVARDAGEVAGVALCEVRRTGEDEQGFVNVLGVRRPWRGQGLGRALLFHAFEAMRARGLMRAGLGVDANNPTGAVRLYERAGMTVERRYDGYRKELS